jgi:hypothetical protein
METGCLSIMDNAAASESRRNALDTFVRRLGAGAMLVAAALWLWSASIDVGGNVAFAQGQFERMADLNRYGSAAAVVAAICAMILFLLRPTATRSDR